MKASFEEQFEAAGENRYLYRKNQKGEALPVAAEEKERFVRQYVRRIWLIMGGMMAALGVFWGLLIWWTVSTSSDFQEKPSYVGTILIAAIAVVLMIWVRGAPARELQGRMSVGRERTRDEMLAIFFKKTSYGQLAMVAMAGVILPFMLTTRFDVFHGWGRLWFASGGALILLAAVQAFRKWRFESEYPDDVVR